MTAAATALQAADPSCESIFGLAIFVGFQHELQSDSNMAQFTNKSAANKVATVSSCREASPLAIGSSDHSLRCRYFMGRAVLLCLLFVVFFTGCGGGGPQTYNLEGTVTYNGKAVPTGWVSHSAYC